MATSRKRQFILTLNYKNDSSEWETISHDVINETDLVKLLAQFPLVIAKLHRRILEEEAIERGEEFTDEDIPF
jgi:hypothetical protein